MIQPSQTPGRVFDFSGRLIAVGFFAAVCLLPGCGSDRLKTAIVRGNITYQGKPVPNGTVMFVPSSGTPAATGEIQADGSYTLTTYRSGDGAVPGSYTVVIVAMGDRSGQGLPEERNPLAPSIVPDIYTSAATSPLRAEVKDEENTIHFNLASQVLK